MNNKLRYLLLAFATVFALVAVAAWQRSTNALNESRTLVDTALLEPAAALLDQNLVLLKQLQAAPLSVKDVGLLEDYLAGIRRDGVLKHATMRQRLEQFGYNNVAIVTLLTAYAPHARTPALKHDVEKFRDYTVSWQRRWGTVMEIFMVGGTYATPEAPFPIDLPDKLRAELAAGR